ncbi:MAG: TolC family protein [Planctomycetota bacterium]
MRVFIPSIAVSVGWLMLVGCESPLGAPDPSEILRRGVADAVERELEPLPELEQRLVTKRPVSDVVPTLAERREELDAIGPSYERSRDRLEVGPDLTGAKQQEVTISLQWTIASAVRSNLDIQIARLQPAINETDVVAAEAVFDALLFSNVDYEWIDEPTAAIALTGTGVIGTAERANEQYRFETGLRKRLISGAEVSVSTDLTRFDNRTPGTVLVPDPSYTAAVRLGVAQPLLRGFGSEVNTAAIRISRNTERSSIQQLRSDLLQLVAATEGAYWDLVFAWRNLAIAQWLVEVGIEVRDVLERRRDFDTRLAQYADAVARVEQRRAEVIRSQRLLRAASDFMKQLVNDPQLPVGAEALLVPADSTVEAPISYSLRDAILTAVSNRPEIQQAILAIDDASIRQIVADNARLPLLDLAAQISFTGLDGGTGVAYDELIDADFVDYVVGLSFEFPLGNRAAEAGFRRARLERSAAVIGYRRAVQAVVLDVKSALRDVISTYELIQASRSFRVAQAENLRALLVEEETLAALTPEFLDLKFTRQETLASARLQEVQALVSFDKSVAQLYRAMGVGLTMNRIDFEVVGDPDVGGSGRLDDGPPG